MQYHVGLGIGHVYTQHQASSDLYQTAGNTSQDDDMELECIPELSDDEEEPLGGIIPDFESSSEHSSDFCNEGGEDEEEEDGWEDEEFIVDEDMYGY